MRKNYCSSYMRKFPHDIEGTVKLKKRRVKIKNMKMLKLTNQNRKICINSIIFIHI